MWSISWSSTWSNIWFNIWLTKAYFLRTNKPYLYYDYQTCHHWFAIFIASRRYHWFTTFITRHCHYYYHWHYLSLKVLEVLIKLPSLRISLYYLTMFFSIRWLSAKANLCHQEICDWSSNKVAYLTQLNLLLRREYQSFFIEPLSEDNPSP